MINLIRYQDACKESYVKENKLIEILVELISLQYNYYYPSIEKNKSKKSWKSRLLNKSNREYALIEKVERLHYELDNLFKNNHDEEFSKQQIMFMKQFCTFIRFCEHIMIYDNLPTNNLYIDSPINTDEYRIVLNEEKYTCYISIKNKKDVVNDLILNVINVKIDRVNTKITTDFIIVEANIQCNSDADLFALNKVFTDLQEEIYKILDNILHDILDSVESKMPIKYYYPF